MAGEATNEKATKGETTKGEARAGSQHGQASPFRPLRPLSNTTELSLTCYARGASYGRHVDNTAARHSEQHWWRHKDEATGRGKAQAPDGRELSVVYYLNVGWGGDAEEQEDDHQQKGGDKGEERRGAAGGGGDSGSGNGKARDRGTERDQDQREGGRGGDDLGGTQQTLDGGNLRLGLPGREGGDTVDISPIADRLVLFMSGEVEHEVLAPGKDRYAVIAWLGPVLLS